MITPTPRTDAEEKKPAFSPSEWIAFTKQLERELAQAQDELAKIKATLADPVAVRVNILRGTIKAPDDLYFEHDTNGPLAKAQADAAAMREALLAEERYQWAVRNRESISDPTDDRILGLKMEIERARSEANTLRKSALSTTAGADILERLRKAEEIIENAKSAFGEHPDSDIDLAQRISDLRDEARKPFHDMTKLMNERDSLRAEVERLLEDKRAFRNRLISAMTQLEEGEYEVRITNAEAKVNEFEAAFHAARKEQP